MGSSPLQAKIIGGAHDTAAKVVLPDPVDHDPGGHGVVGRGQPLGKDPAAPTGLAGFVGWRNIGGGIIQRCWGKAGETRGPGKAGFPRRRT